MSDLGVDKIEKLKTYTDEQIEKMNIEELKSKLKQLQSIAVDGQNIIKSLDKLQRRYKIALFMVIRNSVLPTGKILKKTDYETNKMSYETMQAVIKMIDFERAEKLYKEGVNLEETKNG